MSCEGRRPISQLRVCFVSSSKRNKTSRAIPEAPARDQTNITKRSATTAIGPRSWPPPKNNRAATRCGKRGLAARTGAATDSGEKIRFQVTAARSTKRLDLSTWANRKPGDFLLGRVPRAVRWAFFLGGVCSDFRHLYF